MIKANGGKATDRNEKEINYLESDLSDGFILTSNDYSTLMKRIGQN